MKRLVLSLVLPLAACRGHRGLWPDSAACAGSGPRRPGPDQYTLTWNGVSGRSYFVEVSVDLETWTYAPLVEFGTGGALQWGFDSTTDELFLRLLYTDTVTDDPREDDFDGDGITNLDEVVFFGTDPFVSNDGDGDGYLDADEVAHGTDPDDAGDRPFDPLNPPLANRFVAPLSWWVENKFFDTAEALTARGETARLTEYETLAASIADGSYDLPFLSIQAAVNAASSGDVIEVAPGTYAEAVDLTGKNVRLLARRGSRDETIIMPPASSAQAILLGTGNTADTVVSGFTILNEDGAAIRFQGGTAARVHNVLVQECLNGLVVDGSSPYLFNVVVDGCTGAGATDAGLRVTGSGTVKASNCSFADNVPGNTTAGQVQLSGSSAVLQLVNGIVWSAADRPGGQITTAGGAVALVTWSAVRGTHAGTGNLDATDAAFAHFDTDALVGGQRRLLRTSPCVDQGNPVGLEGFTYWTRRDPDGEIRRFGYALSGTLSTADIGADEYVTRLRFPTFDRRERNVTRTYSSVDEASDIAFLGQLTNGNARVAIINDETIEEPNGTQHNDVTFHEISAATGAIVSNSVWAINRGGFGANETKDPEGLAYDAVNRRLYVTTSHTRVDRYRGGETSVYDPLVDPPSSDYDPRRGVIVTVQLDTNLAPTGNTFTDARDGDWSGIAVANRRTMASFASGVSAVSPVGYDSPNGLIATLQTQLQGNTALQASVRNGGVLVAINTVPKFGEPADGTTYASGTGLPYGSTNGLGGPAPTAGWVLPRPGAVPPSFAVAAPTAGTTTLTLNGPTLDTQRLTVVINGRTYHALYAASHDATLQSLATQLATDIDVAAAVVTVVGGNQTGADDRVITLTAKTDPALVPPLLTARAGTTANLALTGLSTIDGVVLVAGDRVLVKNQASAPQNGIYLAATGAWTRAADFDGTPAGEVTAGRRVAVTAGTTGANTVWALTTTGTITVGSTPLAFSPPVPRVLVVSATVSPAATFPYWTLSDVPAAGLQVVTYLTTVVGQPLGLLPNTTYYFKAWAYSGAGAARVYGRGVEAAAETNSVPPIKINEFFSVPPNGFDWVELFNPSGQAINIGGFVIMDEEQRTDMIAANTIVPARGYFMVNPTPRGLGANSDNIRIFLSNGITPVDLYEQYTRNQQGTNTEGRVWDGGPRGKDFDFDRVGVGNPPPPAPRFESVGGLYHAVTGNPNPHPPTPGAANHIQMDSQQQPTPAKVFQASRNHATQTGIYLHYTNLGVEPAVWRYSPKQQDFHPINVEALALRSQAEIVVGLRSPLSNRTTGDAYALVFSNASNQFLPAGGWAAAAGGLQSVQQLDLDGLGIRSIQWCPQITNGTGATGAYLIIGGPANGGPLRNETGREVFSLYRWDSVASAPVRVVADLSPFAVRPEGVNIVTLNGRRRAIFVEDRYKAQGYDVQNAVHWSLSALNLR